MREAETEYHCRLALHFRAVANADDLKLTSPTLGDALDGIVDQCACEAMNRGLRIILANRQQVAILLLDLNAPRQFGIQFALGSLHQDRIAFDLYGHTLRDRDRFFSNS